MLAAIVLARTRSFTLAGRELFLTQSAVSHAIKSLEAEVECKLFSRTGKGVMVTPAGKHFLQYLDRILEQMETARTLVAPRTARGKERLRLGIGARTREFFLPVVLPAFQKQFSNRLVMLELGDYRRNLELLDSGLLDLAFTVKPEARDGFGYVHLFEDELRFIVSPSHPWARKDRAVLEDLRGSTLLVLQQYNNTVQLLEKHLQAEAITPRHAVEFPDYMPIKALVATGQAVGVLPPWLAAEELRDGTLISLPIGRRPLIREWGLAYHPGQPLSVMDKTFIELCQQAVPGILSRLLGQPLKSGEKKDPKVSAIPESNLAYGAVALGLTLVYNLSIDSLVWAERASGALSVV